MLRGNTIPGMGDGVNQISDVPRREGPPNRRQP